MRGTKRAAMPVSSVLTADGVNGGTLLCLGFAQGRKDTGQPTRQHALAGPGRPDEEQMMAAGGGDLQRPFGLGLPDHVQQVGPLFGRRLLTGLGKGSSS